MEEMKPLQGDGCRHGDEVEYRAPSSDDSSTTSEEMEEKKKARGEWGSKVEFFLAIMGYTVGIGSVWRFPITCSRNGGGAFLIPFFFFLVIAGGPLYYLEVCLGQFSGKSAGLAFEYCPLMKGLGFLQVSLSLICLWLATAIMTWVFFFLYSSVQPIPPWAGCDNVWNTASCTGLGFLQVSLSSLVLWYDAAIMSWVFYFLYIIFNRVLPWTTCGNPWNSGNCQAVSELWHNTSARQATLLTNATATSYNVTAMSALQPTPPGGINQTKFSSSAYEFWEYKVIGRSSGLTEMGSIQPHLVICSLLSWALVVLAVIKGVKTLGKVVYVTATVPYVFLTIMLVRGATLDGAMDGVIQYIRPNFSKLLTVQVWLEAAVQVFYSLGPSWGGVITMASYNKFHQRSFWATTMCVASSGFTSFYNGLVVFTILGFMARESGLSVQDVASASGPGLTFIAFPTAISRMPLPHLWAVLFFLTLVTVVFDSLFGMFETVTSAFIDLFPEQLIRRRVLVNIVTGLMFFVTSLPLTMHGGIYVFQLSDWYFSQFALLVGSVLEAVSVCWIYGTDRFARDISLMTGRETSAILRFTWGVLIPVFLVITFIVMLCRYSAPDYGDGYVYPGWALAVGISCGLMPIAGMLAVAVIEVVRARGGIRQRLRVLLRPSSKWIPNDCAAREEYRLQRYRYESSMMGRIRVNIRGPKDNQIF